MNVYWPEDPSIPSSWVQLGKVRFVFSKRKIWRAYLMKDKYFVVSADCVTVLSGDGKSSKEELDQCRRNIFCFDVDGNLVWQVEKCRRIDGSDCHDSYALVQVESDNGNLLAYVRGIPRHLQRLPGRKGWEDKKYVDGGRFEPINCFEIDFSTGKIVELHDNYCPLPKGWEPSSEKFKYVPAPEPEKTVMIDL